MDCYLTILVHLHNQLNHSSDGLGKSLDAFDCGNFGNSTLDRIVSQFDLDII
jgi:hypothetical protein